MNEQNKYEIIKKLVDTKGNKQRAALTLGISLRQVNRLIKGYKEFGKAFFSHGNKGRKPVTAIPDETKKLVIDLYNMKYFNSNFSHYTELLEQYEDICLSVSTVSSILESQFILSPLATKAKRKRVKDMLSAKMKDAKSKKEKHQIQTNLVTVQDAHSRRPRCAYSGELEQMDASPFPWFGNEVTTLHIAVDDATGIITGAWFDKEETLNGYYHVFYQILDGYGIPYKFLTDRRSVFTYQKKNTGSVEDDTYTQFAYACKQLGVQLESISIPQAKGRVERMFKTLQTRLPVELRLAGITELNAANKFLDSYLQKFNAKFALPIDNTKSVFEIQPSDEKINLTLAVLTERTVDSGHCISFKNEYYRMLNENGEQIHYRKGTRVMLIQAFDGKKYCCVNDKDIHALEIVPERESKSQEFDIDYQKPAPKKQYIPPMNHPWRHQKFGAFVKKQKHSGKGDSTVSA